MQIINLQVRLLYAEAIGVGSDAQNGNELQFYYASATPDQQVQAMVPAQPCHIQLSNPCRVTYSRENEEPTRELLQYRVHQQQTTEQHSHFQHQNPQQQVLNLTVNNNPMRYYHYQNAAELEDSQKPSSQPLVPTPSSQQHSTYQDRVQYPSTSTAHVGSIANQTVYPTAAFQYELEHNYRSLKNVERDQRAEELSSGRLSFPVSTVKRDEITYAHVQSNDPERFRYMNNARQVQHMFPEGAFSHFTMAGFDGATPNKQHKPNGTMSGYSNSGVTANGGNASSSSTAGSTNKSSGVGNYKVDEVNKWFGLNLLTEASEKMKAIQVRILYINPSLSQIYHLTIKLA